MTDVLLLSGGLDSAVCLALRQPELGLFVDYGQPHCDQERVAAARLAQASELRLRRLTVQLPWRPDPNDPAMIVPGRNLVLLGLAAGLAGPDGTITVGCNQDDARNYPDCRPEFVAAAADAMGVLVRAPLLELNKRDVGALARKLGVATQATWSCYYPEAGEPCRRCDACRGRQRALTAAPLELVHLYDGETDPLYMWPNPPRGELPW